MTLLETINQAIKENGFIEVIPGDHLYLRDTLQETQRMMSKDNPFKHLDFSHHPFWLISSEVSEPVAYESLLEGIIDILSGVSE